MKNYSFANKLILRTPLKEIDTDISWDKIKLVFKNSLYREALFVASPSLYKLLETYENNPSAIDKTDVESLKIALYKYYARFSNRCTPFGLYAYVSSIGLAKESKIEIKPNAIRKASKFDTFFLAKLLEFIEQTKEIREVLVYYPNTALYAISDRYRYVEYYYKEAVRLHKISGVDRNDYLDEIVKLAKEGMSIQRLSEALADQEVQTDQLKVFIHTLIDNQFLVSELGITLTGEDYLSHLINIFSQERFAFFEAQQILSLLLDLQNRLEQLEKQTAKVEDYLQLFEYVNQHFDKVAIKQLFQVDGYRDQSDSTLSYATLKQLRTAVQVVNKLSSKPRESNLSRFAKQFVERYEEKEVPLTQALDPDIGINYAKNLGAKTPLLENLSIAPSRQIASVSWDKKKSLLFRRLLQAYQSGQEEIVLTEAEVNAFEENTAAYSDSFSVFFNAFTEKGQDKIQLKAIWGPTATSLLGRFCHEQATYNLVQTTYQQEENLQQGKIIAEIVHLPQARVGNVLHRKNKRSYEIPYLGTSSLPLDQQISVSDLMVSVRNGQIRLRSARLNKEVLPRLSNAHNYSADALPIYHFLCELALKDSSPIGFSWGELQYEYPFLPRVSFKNIVIARASWSLKPKEIKALLEHKKDDRYLDDFITQRQLPTVVTLAMGDNEILINFSNPLSRKVFFSLLKKRPVIELKEFLFQEKSITGQYANEFIATAYKNIESQDEKLNIPVGDYQDTKVENTYSIGDEWLYYKFYCGDKIAEKVLTRGVLPIVEDLKTKDFIEQWFFIRYIDKDGFHLRFRLKLKDKKFFSHCINSIKYHIKPLEKDGLIWKIQVDTYLRETERYGHHSIAATEQLFTNDSNCTLQFCNMIEGEAGEEVRWLFSLLSMDRLLQDFNLNLEQKAAVMKMLKTAFGKEFNRKGQLNKQINELYAKEQNKIDRFLDKATTHQMFYPLWDILDDRSKANINAVSVIKQLDKENKLPNPLLINILPSYLHMICNRVFLNKQRLHEMVVYDFMYKYYSKQLYTQKKNQNKQASI